MGASGEAGSSTVTTVSSTAPLFLGGPTFALRSWGLAREQPPPPPPPRPLQPPAPLLPQPPGQGHASGEAEERSGWGRAGGAQGRVWPVAGAGGAAGGTGAYGAGVVAVEEEGHEGSSLQLEKKGSSPPPAPSPPPPAPPTAPAPPSPYVLPPYLSGYTESQVSTRVHSHGLGC